ncbi:MAG: hypothetical protein ACXAEU_11415 [Candidatus Hodarchaeales archaeon]|jgi:ABC-type transport system involved in cytochrome c biogenesis permease subunit
MEIKLFVVIVLYSLALVLIVHFFSMVLLEVYHSDDPKAKWSVIRNFLYSMVMRLIVHLSGGDYKYLPSSRQRATL